MEILNVSVDVLKPDPKQPRKAFDNVQVDEMAVNISTQGVINPIEIDTDNVIITGEIRWRAAKKAGLTTVPTKMLSGIKPFERFMRQVSENVHHNTMTVWDTANALGRLQNFNDRRPITTRELGEKLGKSQPWIVEHLKLLEETKEIKNYLKKPEAKASYVVEIQRRVPAAYQEEVKKKIIDDTIGTRRGIRGLGMALQHHPDKAAELLALDFTGMGDAQITDTINSLAPTPMKQIENIVLRGAKLRAVTKHLVYIIESTTLNDYAPLEIPEIKLLLSKLEVAIPKFLESGRKELPEVVK